MTKVPSEVQVPSEVLSPVGRRGVTEKYVLVTFGLLCGLRHVSVTKLLHELEWSELY